jgi:hypothetical protein
MRSGRIPRIRRDLTVGNAQRPRPAIAFRDVDPLDGLRVVGTLPQSRRQLGQICFRPSLEPLDALPIHARRAFVGPDFRPGRRQRFGREHLVHQRVPFAAFDAVDQRRQHPLRPNRRFGPRKVACGLSALRSLIGTPGVLLLRFGHRASPFLPPFPKTGLSCPVREGGDDKSRTMGPPQWMAAYMIFSSVASRAENSSTTLPWRQTRIRSDSASSSGR